MKFSNGAREPEVEEPHQDLLTTSNPSPFRPETIIQVEFDQVVEPKVLSPNDLLALSQLYGTSGKVAKIIGSSEAFVRQNLSKSWKKAKNEDKIK